MSVNYAVDTDIEELFAQDIRDEKQTRGGQALGKVKPKLAVLQSETEVPLIGEAPWWKIAPTIFQVELKTGVIHRLAPDRFWWQQKEL